MEQDDEPQDQQRENSVRRNGLFLDSYWRGHAAWSKAAVIHIRWSGDIRKFEDGRQVVHPLGAAAKKTGDFKLKDEE